MKKIILTSDICVDKESLHDFLARELAFPDWYGGNLDALYDCLTDLREEVTIAVPDLDGIEAQLGGYARKVMRVFIDASRENPNLYLEAT